LTHALQLRLWRCCLQVCVTSPALAPWAQIPLALAAGIEHAPGGAAELVKTAITLGADAAALSPIAAGMPSLESIQVPDQVELLTNFLRTRSPPSVFTLSAMATVSTATAPATGVMPALLDANYIVPALVLGFLAMNLQVDSKYTTPLHALMARPALRTVQSAVSISKLGRAPTA